MKSQLRTKLNLDDIKAAIRKHVGAPDNAKVHLIIKTRMISDFNGRVLTEADDIEEYRHATREKYLSGAEVVA